MWYQRFCNVECLYQSLPGGEVDREDGLTPLYFNILFASLISGTCFGSYISSVASDDSWSREPTQ